MNILNYKMNQNCEQKLKPIFLMKEIVEHNIKKLEANMLQKFVEYIVADLKSEYNAQFYSILNYLVEKEHIYEKQLILDSLNNITTEKIKQISRADIFSSQVLKPFLKLTNEELHNLIMQLVTYLLDKEATELISNQLMQKHLKKKSVKHVNGYGILNTTFKTPAR